MVSVDDSVLVDIGVVKAARLSTYFCYVVEMRWVSLYKDN